MSDREYVSATNTLSASTEESRAPDQIPSSRHADNLHRLSRGLLLGVLLTALAVGVIYAREQPWQALASLGVLLVSLSCLGLGRAAIERGELEKAGYWLLANALIAYGSAELLWQGPTLQNLISGILIMLVIGTIAFPHRWYIWIGTALIHLLWTWLINVSPPFPRYPLDTAWESHLVFILTMLVIMDIAGRVFRLGGQLSTLEERVDNLRQADTTLRRQLTELSVLHAVAVAGTEAADEDALLERATQIIGETLYPDNFGILLLEPDRKHLRPHPSYRFSGEMERMGVVPLGKGITGTVAAEGKSICVTNAQRSHHYVEFDLRTRSELCVPIQIGGEILGVINTESSQVNAFSTADEQLLTTFAGQLATAIDRLRRTRESQRKAQQMATIYNLGHQITSILSLDDLLPAIVRLIVDSLDLYNAEIALLEDNILKFRAGYGGYTNPQHSVRARYSLKTTQGITGKAALTGTSLLVPDVRESEDYVDYPPLPHVRAELAVPLKAKGEIIGVLDVKSDEPYGLTENDAATLEILAAQVAVAVQNARLFEAQQEQRRELTGLYETALATTSQLEPDLMLRRLYDQIQQLLNPDFFAAALYDAELDEVSIVLAIEGGKSVPDFVDLHIPLKKSGLSGWVMRSRESLYLADMEQDTLPLTPRYVGKTRTWFGVPLIAHDRLIGAISVQSAHPNAFSMTQRRFLESVANQVAVALENARLYRSALEANQRMAILHRTSQEFVTASVDPEQVYVAIHEAASQLMASEAFVISLLNKTEESINLVYIVDRSGRHAPEQIPSDRGISGQVISTGKPLLVPEIDENESLDPVHFGDPDPVHSILAVPLKLGGKVFGMLSAQSYEPRAHTIEDQRLLEMLASHAAAALENTRLLRAERERKAELEAIRQASLQVTSSLELEPVLQAILEHSLKIIDADNAHIFLYDGEKLSFGAGLWSEGGRTGLFAEPRSDGLTYRVARTGKRVVVHNMKSHPLFVDTPWDGAIVGLPLKLGEKITGVMNVAFHQPHYFDENELRTLALLGDQAAIAIRNAELFEAAQRQLEELRLLHNVATACAEATDEDIIIERATELIGRSLYPDNFGIMLVDDSSAQLHFHASYRGLPERHRTCKLRLGEGIAGQVAESGH
ncbi:MAG: GAF domain-containing protein, partial [Anaerolineae bacterium]